MRSRQQKERTPKSRTFKNSALLLRLLGIWGAQTDKPPTGIGRVLRQELVAWPDRFPDARFAPGIVQSFKTNPIQKDDVRADNQRPGDRRCPSGVALDFTAFWQTRGSN